MSNFSLFNADLPRPTSGRGSALPFIADSLSWQLFGVIMLTIFLIASPVVLANSNLNEAAIPDSNTNTFSSIQSISDEGHKGPVRHYIQNFDLLFGWPRTMVGNIPVMSRCPTVTDFDSNRDWEISVITTENRLHVYQHDGASYPGFPMSPHQGNRPQVWENPRQNATSAAGDITGNGLPELVYTTDIGYLHVITEEEDEPEPFPIDLGRGVICGVTALGDVNRDDDMDIVFNTASTHPDSIEANAWLHVFGNNGQEIRGFPVPYPRGAGGSPAIGDITGDDNIEIVVGNARYLDQPGQIWAWRRDGAQVEGFPTGSFQTIHGSPSLTDINGDGALEIVFWAASFEGDFAGIYAFTGTGQLVEGYPLECPVGHPDGGVAIADITGDNIAEIVYGTYEDGEGALIYAWSVTGAALEHFPVRVRSSIVGSAILADVSGDGIVDVVAVVAPSGEYAGEIVGFDYTGEAVEDFPVSLERYDAWAFAGTPSIWDIDNDGDMDLIAVTTDRRILIWDTPGRVTEDVWLTYKGGMNRSGVRPVESPTDTPLERDVHMPELVGVSAYPNPFNSMTRITFKADSRGFADLDLVDQQGRLIKQLYSGSVSTGTLEISIDAQELNLSAGLYFCRWTSGGVGGAERLLFIP